MEKEAERVTEANVERKRKKTMGRQKIEIKPIKCIDARNVCFSKRRNGLFKKAAQLCALTDAHLAIIVFSPAGKPYTFGQPSVDALVDGHLDPASYVAVTTEAAAKAAILREHHIEEQRLETAIKEETQRRTAIDAAARAAGVRTTDDDDVRGKGMADLVAMLPALERVQAEAIAVKRAYEIFAAEDAFMMQQCAAAAGAAGDAFQFQYSSAAGAGGTFTADGGGGGGAGSSNHKEDMDLQMMMMMGGGNVGHALPFAPTMLQPSDLPPQPPYNYNYGSDHNHVACYGNVYGYGYDLGDGSGHGAAMGGSGYYGTTTATTCNFFG